MRPTIITATAPKKVAGSRGSGAWTACGLDRLAVFSNLAQRGRLLVFAPEIDVQVGYLLVQRGPTDPAPARRGLDAAGAPQRRSISARSSAATFSPAWLRAAAARPAAPPPARRRLVGVSGPVRRRAEHERALERVAQLADVARPAPAPQQRQRPSSRPVARRPARAPCAPGSARPAARRPRGARAAAARRCGRRRAGRTGPRGSGPRAPRPRGRGWSRRPPARRPAARRRADAAEHPLLQHAQQLHLDVERQLADLVEEQRAAVRRLEAPGCARDRAR